MHDVASNFFRPNIGSIGWFGRSGFGERRGLVRSFAVNEVEIPAAWVERVSIFDLRQPSRGR